MPGVQESRGECSDRLIAMTRLYVARHLEIWPQFVGAIIIGSVANREARADSDVDCIFLFENVDERLVPAEFVWNPQTDDILDIFAVEAAAIGGVQIDARRVAIGDFASEVWEDGYRHDMTNAVVISDREQRIAGIFEEKLPYPDSLRRSRIREHLTWSQYYLEEWRLEKWMLRGGLIAAHEQISLAFEGLLCLLHTYNRVWLPWRYRLLVSALKLDWLPTNFREHAHVVLSTGTLTAEALTPRIRAARSLLSSIEDRLQCDHLIRDSKNFFAETHPSLGYAHNMPEWRHEHRKMLDAQKNI